MAQLDAQRIKKLKAGEMCGNVFTAFCGAVLIYFAVTFSIAYAQNLPDLKIIVWATAAPLMVIGVAVAAFCNLKFGSELDRIVDVYIRDVCVENASLLHPERDSLSFFVCLTESTVELSVNSYKEKIIFDFSAFGKLRAARKLYVLTAIDRRISSTFIKLWERGGEFKSVNYCEKDGTRRKSGKTVPIIADGVPDRVALKNYRKNK